MRKLQCSKISRRHFVKHFGGGALYTVVAGTPLSSSLLHSPKSKAKNLAQTPELFDEFMHYDAIGLSELLKSKQLSRAELLEVIIKRIEHFNPIINAINIKLYERALDRVSKVNINSPFSGVPILIKDMIDIGGVLRTDGSKLLQNNIPEQSVDYIKVLEQSGLLIVGRTNVPEQASITNTWNASYGPTLNPWDTSKTVFGSSGGSAAAVATGIVPLAHGTDGAGSNRLPPNTCGVFGFKPTRSRLASGEKDGSDDFLKTNSGISRTVRDSEKLFISTQKKLNNPYPIFLKSVKSRPLRPLKIGYIRTGLQGYEVDNDIIVKQDEVAKLLTNLGHQVQEVSIPINGNEFFEKFNSFFLSKFTPLVNHIITNNKAYKEIDDIQELSYFLKSEAIFVSTINSTQLKQAENYIRNYVPKVFEGLFMEYDVLFSAVCPIKTQPIDYINPFKDNFESKKFILSQTLSLTSFANICGHPAMSVPLSDINKLPLGSMFQGAKGEDEILYQLAYQLEEVKPWREQWPAMVYKLEVLISFLII